MCGNASQLIEQKTCFGVEKKHSIHFIIDRDTGDIQYNIINLTVIEQRRFFFIKYANSKKCVMI